MLAKARPALMADFRRFYMLDLRLLGHGLDVTYAADLAAWLPEQAMVWRVLDPRAAWDTTQQLIANVADATAFLAWTKSRDAQHKGARWDGQVRRPGEKKEHRGEGLTRVEFDRRLAAAKRKYSR